MQCLSILKSLFRFVCTNSWSHEQHIIFISQELREEFEKESSKTGKHRLLLTMAVPAGIEYIDKGYDVPKLNRYEISGIKHGGN